MQDLPIQGVNQLTFQQERRQVLTHILKGGHDRELVDGAPALARCRAAGGDRADLTHAHVRRSRSLRDVGVDWYW